MILKQLMLLLQNLQAEVKTFSAYETKADAKAEVANADANKDNDNNNCNRKTIFKSPYFYYALASTVLIISAVIVYYYTNTAEALNFNDINFDPNNINNTLPTDLRARDESLPRFEQPINSSTAKATNDSTDSNYTIRPSENQFNRYFKYVEPDIKYIDEKNLSGHKGYDS